MTKSKMMMMIAAGAACLAVLLDFNGRHIKRGVVEQYKITAVHAPVFETCLSAMNKHHFDFQNGANKAQGCACIAKQAVSTLGPNKIMAYRHAYGPMVKYIKKTRHKLKPVTLRKHQVNFDNAVFNAVRIHHVPLDQAQSISRALLRDVDYCGNDQSHTKDNVQSMAALPDYLVPVLHQGPKIATAVNSNVQNNSIRRTEAPLVSQSSSLRGGSR